MQWCTHCSLASCNVCPHFIHSEGFYKVSISPKYFSCELGEFHILIVMRGDYYKIGAFQFGLPNSFTCSDSFCFGCVVLGKDGSVPFFLTSAYCNRKRLQVWVKHAFDGCIEIVHVDMQYRSLRHIYPSLINFQPKGSNFLDLHILYSKIIVLSIGKSKILELFY